MLKKTALITGVTGQDGRLMADYLLKNSYNVIGLSQSQAHFLQHDNYIHQHCDYKNKKHIIELIKEFQPNEVYHFAANSFPGTTPSQADQLIEDNVSSFLNVLNACVDCAPQSRFFNASSAYIFKPKTSKYTLLSELSPSTPYGISKLRCYQVGASLRDTKNYFLVNGIFFNHESIYRDDRFVTTKIIKSALEIKNKTRDTLELGNLKITRDWSHALDFIPIIHKSLNAHTPKDYIFSSGIETSLQNFINITFQKLGMTLEWLGEADNLIAKDAKTGQIRILSKNELIRKTDYSYLVGDNTETIRELGLKINYSVEDIIEELIKHYSQTAGNC